MDKNRARTLQADFIFLNTLALQEIKGGGAFGHRIRSIVYEAAVLTPLDLSEYGSGTGVKTRLVDQRFNNIISNKIAVGSGLFIRTGVRGYFQLTPFGMNISYDDLYKLIYKKKRRKRKKIAPLPFDENTIIEEGEKSTRTVTYKKRSVVLREQAKRDNKKNDPDGLSRCEICDTLTEKDVIINGVVTHVDTIIAHHIDPISEMDDKGNKTKYSDAVKHIACLCPNCHDTLHKISPTPHPVDLREALKLLIP